MFGFGVNLLTTSNINYKSKIKNSEIEISKSEIKKF